MREIFKIIKEYFILLLGIGLVTFFSIAFYTKGLVLLSIFITIGVIFIVIGLLKIRKKKGEN